MRFDGERWRWRGELWFATTFRTRGRTRWEEAPGEIFRRSFTQRTSWRWVGTDIWRRQRAGVTCGVLRVAGVVIPRRREWRLRMILRCRTCGWCSRCSWAVILGIGTMRAIFCGRHWDRAMCWPRRMQVFRRGCISQWGWGSRLDMEFG